MRQNDRKTRQMVLTFIANARRMLPIKSETQRQNARGAL